MQVKVKKSDENRQSSSLNHESQAQTATNVADHRTYVIQRRELDAMSARSPRTQQLRQMQSDADQHSQQRLSPTSTSASKSSVQRKVLINDAVRAEKVDDAAEIKTASADSYSRFYKDESEMSKHLVSKQAVGVGLNKSKALWYRIPLLEQQQFFVFGENHNAITGGQIYKESNLTKPILSEAPPGVGAEDYVSNIQGKADKQGAAVAVDENGSKLFQALSLAKSSPARAFPANTPPIAKVGGGRGIPLPNIPDGDLSARDVNYGSHNLVVRGDDGQAQWWKQPDAPVSVINNAPQQYSAPIAEAIKGLFPIVFKVDALTDDADEAWKYLSGTNWQQSPRDARASNYRERIIGNHLEVLFKLVKEKVSTDYGEFRKDDTSGRKKLAATASADDYRNEYMLAGIKEGAKNNKYSMSNIGGAHLDAIEARLGSIPLVKNARLFGEYGKLAIQAPDPFDDWLKKTPPSLDAAASWYIKKKSDYQVLKENLQTYTAKAPALRASDIQTLLDLSEALMKRKRVIWSGDNGKKDRVTQVDALILYLKVGADLKTKCRV
jgi:hypothetical protein